MIDPFKSDSTRRIAVLGAPIDIGASQRGTLMGPAALRTAGLLTLLDRLGFDVKDHGDASISEGADLTLSHVTLTDNQASGFIGLFAPAGTPAPTIKKISHEVAAILATPGAHAAAHTLTAAIAYEDDETFARFLAGESVKWKQALASLDLGQ